MTTTADRGLFSADDVPEPRTPRQSAALVRRALREAATAQRRAAKGAAKQAERDAQFAALAGPTIPLPAAMTTRNDAPHSMTVSHAVDLVRKVITRTGVLTVDVETSGYPVGHELFVLRTVQLGDGDTAVVFDAEDPWQYNAVRDLLATAPWLHAFSAAADLVPLAYVELIDYESGWDRMYDPSIPALLGDPGGNESDSDRGLKQLAPRTLGDVAVTPVATAARAELFKANKWLTDTELDTPIERSGWAQVDRSCTTMVTYAASDVLDTAPLWSALPRVPPAVLARERAVQAATARVTRYGLPLDAAHIRNLTARHTVERANAAIRIEALGVTNAGSDRQVAIRLAELGVDLPRTKPSVRFPEGQLSVASGVLDPFKDLPGQAGELVRARLDYQHHDTALTLFCTPYGALCEHGDGRVRPTIYTLGTATGRMAAVRPNCQQLPQTGGIRAMITADPGYLLISADFSGVELRVLAALSGDAELLRIITEADAAPPGARVDIHWRIARQVWGDNATKLQRYRVKRAVFGKYYGAGIAKIALTLGISEAEAIAIVETLDSIAPGAAAWSQQLQRAVCNGHIEFPTYSGRVIHFPRYTSHKSPNYAIQGTARELLVDAILRWRDTRWGRSIIVPVHDEVLAMVPADEARDATSELVRCMETELYGVTIKAAASEPSYAWADAA